MAASVQPLGILGEARIQDELRRAVAVATDAAAYHRRNLRLVLICIDDFLVGLAVIAFSLHISNGDLAQVFFYLGLLRALCVPMWTVLISFWLEERGNR